MAGASTGGRAGASSSTSRVRTGGRVGGAGGPRRAGPGPGAPDSAPPEAEAAGPDAPPRVRWGRRGLLQGAAVAGYVQAQGRAEALPALPAAGALQRPGLGDGRDTALRPVLRKPQTALVGGGEAVQAAPAWLEGTWDVAPVLVGVDFPQGKQFLSRETPGVLKASIVECSDIGKSVPEAPVVQRLKWIWDPDAGAPVADLPHNIASSMNALLGAGTGAEVQYLERSAFNRDGGRRLSVLYSTPRRGDTFDQERDARKVELFLNYGRGSTAGESFTVERLWRQVNQARNQGSVGDYAITERFQRREGGPEVGYERFISAFLQPVDPRYFDVGDKAVAVYRFEGVLRPAAT